MATEVLLAKYNQEFDELKCRLKNKSWHQFTAEERREWIDRGLLLHKCSAELAEQEMARRRLLPPPLPKQLGRGCRVPKANHKLLDENFFIHDRKLWDFLEGFSDC